MAWTTPSTAVAGSVLTADWLNTYLRDNLLYLFQATYPVGSLYFNATNSTNPATLLGFGTWVAFGAGRVPVGYDATQTEFNAAEKTGGSNTHTLTTAEIPAHAHTQRVKAGGGAETDIQRATDRTGAESNGTSTTADAGGGGSHNNLQPFITVFMWKRTA